MTFNQLFSIVIPIYNEERTIAELASRIHCEMSKLGRRYELIFVDDGSTDNSKNVAVGLVSDNPNVKLVELRRNYGKALALREGFRLARGDCLITMDGDMQDEPSEIHKLVEKLEQGFDLVSGWKVQRQDPFEKKLPSKLFNFVVGTALDLPLHDFNSGFKAYRRQVVANVPLYGELHRFIPALAHWQGFRVTEIPVKHNERKYGVSKFGYKRYFKGLFDFMSVFFLTRYFYCPMHFFAKIGLLLSISGFLICLYLTSLWFSGETIGGRPLLLLGVLLLILGTQFFSTGLIAELFNMRTDHICSFGDVFVNQIHTHENLRRTDFEL